MSAELVRAFRPQPFSTAPAEWFYVCDEGALAQAFIDDVAISGAPCDNCGSKGGTGRYRLRASATPGGGHVVVCECCPASYRTRLMPAEQVVFPC